MVRLGALPSFALCVCLVALSACGSDDAPFASADGGGAGSSGAGGSSGTAGASGAPNAGAGGVAAGGAAGGGPISCTGTWAPTPQVVLRTGPQVEIASPTLSPDELELFYSSKEPSLTEWHFRRSVRTDKTVEFAEGAVLPELDAACATADQDRSVDLSRDGLRAYVGCYLLNMSPPLEGPLRVARRTAIGAPWVLDPSTGPRVGPSVSVSTNELELYSTTKSRPGPPLLYTRTSTSTSFGDGAWVPGLESVNMETLDSSPDDLSVLGLLQFGIAIASRSAPSGPFGSATTLIAGTPTDTVGAPELSADCRSLYYIHVVSDTSPAVYTIEMRAR